MAKSIIPVKGTRDYLPEEMRVRDAMQEIILKSYQKNGFSKIQTPILENIENLIKSDGGENLNMIFKILKRGQKLDLTKDGVTENDLVDAGLRFDLTLPLSRYYANNRANLRVPFKVIQIGEVFRAERPQKGRLREFYQCDIDIIGDSSSDAEIELIHTTAKTLRALGFNDFIIRVNDRQILFDLIESAGFAKEEVLSVCITFDKLDKVGLSGVQAELEEKGFAKSAIETFMESISHHASEGLGAMSKYCSHPEVITSLQNIIDSVTRLSKGTYRVEYDRSLVRGMGYYTGTIFEIVSPEFGSSIAGGGRYDKMIGTLIGEDIPAVGFSIGFERIADILMNRTDRTFETGGKRLALLYDKETPFVEVVEKADEIRMNGYDVSTIVKSKKVGKQLNSLEKDGFVEAFLMGEDVLKMLKGDAE